MATALRKKLTAPEGEVREGEEGPDEEEMDSTSGRAKLRSRKRSAKGAKHTKAPMDDEGCGCGGAKKGRKAACDGNCGGSMKRDRADALTPQEYLAACELGIQNRSRSYIRSRLDTAMNLTPSTVRADLKCGKGSISEGEKCTKGAAQRVNPNDRYSLKGRAKAEAKTGAIKGALLGAAGGYIAGALTGRPGAGLAQAAAGAGAGAAYGAAAGAVRGAGGAALNRAGRAYGRNRENIRRTNEAIKKKAPAWEKEINAAYGKLHQGKMTNAQVVGVEMKQAKEMDRILNRNSTQIWTNANRSWASVDRERSRRGRRDSIYAAGFTPDPAALAI